MFPVPEDKGSVSKRKTMKHVQHLYRCPVSTSVAAPPKNTRSHTDSSCLAAMCKLTYMHLILFDKTLGQKESFQCQEIHCVFQ